MSGPASSVTGSKLSCRLANDFQRRSDDSAVVALEAYMMPTDQLYNLSLTSWCSSYFVVERISALGLGLQPQCLCRMKDSVLLSREYSPYLASAVVDLKILVIVHSASRDRNWFEKAAVRLCSLT